MTVQVLHGDALDILPTLSGIDACVCDPPYLLTSIVDRFGKPNSAPAKAGSDGRFKRLSGGFMGRTWDAPELPPIDPAFAHWMAGFIDGEGCFSVHKKTVNGCKTFDCQFSLSLRADDADIVTEMKRQLGGIGSIAERPSRVENTCKQVRYCISSKADCLRLREILRVFPLRAKKARDFEVWSLALDEWLEHEPGGSWDGMEYFRDYLMAVRRYGSHFSPEQLFHYRWARRVFDALKPGAHLVAFGGTRTFHRMACAIEDAGFEIRDTLMWVYGSGFPKSHDVSKGIDKAAGAVRGIVSHLSSDGVQRAPREMQPGGGDRRDTYVPTQTAPATPEAAQWAGWGTALKPAFEPIILARKPLIGTVVQNVLAHGTGALNIDACRIGTETITQRQKDMTAYHGNQLAGGQHRGEIKQTGVLTHTTGRWPANLCHDGSDEVEAAFPQTETHPKTQSGYESGNSTSWRLPVDSGRTYGSDTGSASRFYYCAKADADDRAWSRHPTVKPLALMKWLVRLVTPLGGTVLDCFAGSGTTGEAAEREGFNAVLIEREAEYIADIHRRLGRASGADTPLFAEPAA